MHKEKDRVVAIREVGLDYPGAKTPVLRTNQELFLKEFLTAVRSDEDLKDLPLVLHVKDMSFDKQDASARCLSIFKEVGYPVSHRIYRHSFLGTRREADAWIEAFPNVVFGASPKALSAPEETRDFFRSASLDRILVETDASYQKHCPVGGMGPPVTTPFHVGIVYKWLAGLRDVDSLTLISRTVNANFMDFYEIDVSRPSDQ